ncbi:helix-turn-helix domain-containing protein [Actinomadura litoris]|uniref:Helix-turn-helix domain-containing protein n=1 Tax=Actinomadura litoris TaxID=2678616 RepID=A0A7K1LAP3_9ACTN|nr:helix-turn-helix transcriptional regulator [Actinomadura litoris]MUN41501.1 helix-turn-helix domain-containing protein [Actinomadura litoris]
MQSAKLNGDRLRALREDNELTTTELAALVSVQMGRRVHQSTITKYEMGRRQPSPKMFGSICRVLRCEKDTLLMRESEQETV